MVLSYWVGMRTDYAVIQGENQLSTVSTSRKFNRKTRGKSRWDPSTQISANGPACRESRSNDFTKQVNQRYSQKVMFTLYLIFIPEENGSNYRDNELNSFRAFI